MGTVTETENGSLTADHKVLDHDSITGITELFVKHQSSNTSFCFFQILTDQYTLSKSKSISL